MRSEHVRLFAESRHLRPRLAEIDAHLFVASPVIVEINEEVEYKGGAGAETSADHGERGGKKRVTYNFQHACFVL